MQRSFDPLDSPAYHLWLVANRWQRFIRRVLSPMDLTYVQYTIMAAILRLADSEEHVTQARICRFAELDPNMCSEVVRSLEAKGLLDRRPHPDDGRAAVLALTSGGRDLVWKARNEIVPLIEQFFSPIGGGLPDLVRMLHELNEQAPSA